MRGKLRLAELRRSRNCRPRRERPCPNRPASRGNRHHTNQASRLPAWLRVSTVPCTHWPRTPRQSMAPIFPPQLCAPSYTAVSVVRCAPLCCITISVVVHHNCNCAENYVQTFLDFSHQPGTGTCDGYAAAGRALRQPALVNYDAAAMSRHANRLERHNGNTVPSGSFADTP